MTNFSKQTKQSKMPKRSPTYSRNLKRQAKFTRKYLQKEATKNQSQIPREYSRKFSLLKKKGTDFLNKAGIDESHGEKHAYEVLKLATIASTGLHWYLVLVSNLAAFLHDFDDKKYFKDNNDYENARFLLKEVGFSDRIIDLVVFSISLVSCSTNKDNVPKAPKSTPRRFRVFIDTFINAMLIARQSDRIKGVSLPRMIEYGRRIKDGKVIQPLYVASTACVLNRQELYAKAARVERYRRYDGKSASAIDHIYDKLLHILAGITNPHLKSMVKDQQLKLEKLCLHFGRNGGHITLEEVEQYY
jgi:hypothetical protein